MRNVLVAIGNSGAPELAAEAERLIDDAEPQVRGAAIWALQRLAPERVPLLAAERLAKETHPDVRERMAGGSHRGVCMTRHFDIAPRSFHLPALHRRPQEIAYSKAAAGAVAVGALAFGALALGRSPSGRSPSTGSR